MHRTSCCHCRCRTDFRLTTALRARNKRSGRNYPANAGRHIQRFCHFFIRIMIFFLHAQKNCRHNAARTRRRRCNNSFHTGVGLSHFDCLFHHAPKKIAADRLCLLHIVLQLSAVRTHKPAAGMQGSVVVLIRLFHRLVHALQLYKGFLLCNLPLPAVIFLDQLPETAACRCSVLADLFQ